MLQIWFVEISVYKMNQINLMLRLDILKKIGWKLLMNGSIWWE